jgi:EmrB/QacA subfamily drug resistance transporter
MAKVRTTHEMVGDRTHKEVMFIIYALMLAMLLAALDQTIVSTALPKIASDLHGLNKYSWVATAYLLTSAVSTPLYGKISDMFGRKRVLQSAIIIFLIGSALCGLSQTMTELVAFRAIQGIGAGGLLTLVLAVVGDIIPPRQRGKYQGYFGAVFAISSIVGPLLGGFFTGIGNDGWRLIFYVNIPLGIIALLTIAARLHLPVKKTKHKIDFAGAGLLSLSTVSLILIAVWGGTTYKWLSSEIIGLAILLLITVPLFIYRETKAEEPIIPLHLFKNDIFRVATLMSLISGFTMFGAILFIPEYQQIVRGYTPLKSGLMMLPLILGLMGSLLTVGRIITKTGKYKIYPVIGALISTFGYFLFSHVNLMTGEVTIGIWMLIIGIGIGPFNQVTTLAVQNSTERENLGTATSTVTFFRSLGSSLGASIFGAVLINRLTANLHKNLPAAAAKHLSTNTLRSTTVASQHLPAAINHDVLLSYVNAFHVVFLIGVPMALLNFLVATRLRETPLRTSAHETGANEALQT